MESSTPGYTVGMRVEIGIPLSDASLFRDWAMIKEIDEDFLLVQLSRDVLPSGAYLSIGQIVSLYNEIDFQIYRYHAFVLSKGFDQEILLRLTGETFPEEAREFYRIDSFVPIKIHSLPDQNPIAVMRQWELRKEQRLADQRARQKRQDAIRRKQLETEEQSRVQRLMEGILLSEPDGLRPVFVQEEPDDEYTVSWGAVASIAANLSGSGIRITTDQDYLIGENLLLEVFVPSVGRVIDVVARVVYSTRDEAAGLGQRRFLTGMQFTQLDESGRFALNNHISSIQLRRIRQLKGLTDAASLVKDDCSNPKNEIMCADVAENDSSRDRQKKPTVVATGQNRLQHLVLGLLIICIVVPLCFYLFRYVENQPVNEIQVLFENGIAKSLRAD